MQVLAEGANAMIPLDKADRGLRVTAALVWDQGVQTAGEDGSERPATDGGLALRALFVPLAQVGPRSARSGPVGRASRGLGRKKDRADAARIVHRANLGSLTEPPFLRLDDAREPGVETLRIGRLDQQGYLLLCAYAAGGRGPGSFAAYRVRSVVTHAGEGAFTVPLYGRNEASHWAAVALVDFTDPGGLRIFQVEAYSAVRSGRRPVLHSDGTFEMDLGPAES